MKFPDMICIRQDFDKQMLDDIAGEIKNQLTHLNLGSHVQIEQTVAVACSSRGIANYGTVVKCVVSHLKELGLKPFLFPAMGSHGSATAEGQKMVLEHLGVTEEHTGAPIQSSLEVIEIDRTEDNIPVYLDKLAAAANHLVLINRIKKHTEFEYWFESGLLKMMAIGLGKQAGAAVYHEAMMTLGYPRIILTVARKIMQHTNLLFGLGIVENGYGHTARIGIGRSDSIEEMERGLFEEAKCLTPCLPFEDIDILIIDEIGKDISGTGFDTKVVGRIGLPLVCKDPETPRIKRILVCDLSLKSDGNAVGVGIADFITQRLLNRIDMDALYMNSITGACPEMGKIPLTLKTDHEALDTAIKSLGLIPKEKLKIMRIKNTAQISQMDVSEAYAEELAKRSDLHVEVEKREMAFDKDGNLVPF